MPQNADVRSSVRYLRYWVDINMLTGNEKKKKDDFRKEIEWPHWLVNELGLE